MRELIGGPADGAIIRVDAELKDLLVPCIVTPTAPSMQPSALGDELTTGFQVIALYTLKQTGTGHKVFQFASLTS